MIKYRIVKIDEKKFIVQAKKYLFWHSLGTDCYGEYRIIEYATFKGAMEALEELKRKLDKKKFKKVIWNVM